MGSDNHISRSDLIFCNDEFSCDDPLQIFRYLQKHSKKLRFKILASFLSECTATLRTEIRQLPRSYRQQIPDFQSLLSLASFVLSETKTSKKPSYVPLEGALLCASQVALFIGYFEAENIEYNFRNQNVVVLGLRSGLFAAIAISVSESLSELASIGPESVRAAFRFHSFVDQFSQMVESREATKNLKSWGYTISGISEIAIQKEIDEFNAQRKHSALSMIRMSNIDHNMVNLTGPPSRVELFLQFSNILHYSEYTSTPIHSGICNVNDVYCHEDIDTIIKPLDTRKWHNLAVRLSILSPNSGAPFCAKSAFQLLEQVCNELLTKPFNQSNLMRSTSAFLSSLNSSDAEIRIFHHGSSKSYNQLYSTMKTSFSETKIIQLNISEWSRNNFDHITSVTNYSKLAIVGMSCRMPGGANNPNLLFDLLTNGRDVHSRVPPDRFDIVTHFDPAGIIENASETPFGNFIDNPGLFDASFFNMTPNEAEQTDPMHRIALLTAYEALEMSGFSPNRTLSTNLKRVGTFYGVASDDYREVNAGQNIKTYATPGGERAFANGRINYFFKFGGPSINIDTACSSSGAAINLACSLLWSGQVDLAIAGGLNVITNPDNYCMLSKGHFLSKTGQCKVWSKEADGYCRADGIGCIVIKRLEDAIAENDSVIATILAASTNHSAEAVSITYPHSGAQMDNYNQVLQQAGIDPLDVCYVELHGTGTQAGDRVESDSVANVFAPLEPARSKENPLYVGAIKSNIGHGEAAAGVASLIKVILAYQNNQIPQNIGIGNEMNPEVAKNIHNRNIQMVTENTPWPKLKGKKRYAIANSFGAHGGNTTFLLEDAPVKLKVGIDPRGVYPILLSAKCLVSLEGNVKSLINYLDRNPNTVLADLSYTLCARRIHHHTRIGTTVKNVNQLKRFLTSSEKDLKNLRPVPKTPSIAFAFTGQGALYEGVAVQLFKYFPTFSKEILALDRILKQMGFPSVIPVIQTTIHIKDTSPLVSPLAILVIEIALTKFWEQLGIIPSMVIGHSLGEYAALVAAGVLSPADAIFLVGKRAQIILDTCKVGSHLMLSIRASVETIDKIVGNIPYEIACLNTATDTVITSTSSHILAIQKLIKRSGLKCFCLETPFAFHSSTLDLMLDNFEELAQKMTFNPPKIPVISPLLATFIKEEKTIDAKYLRRSSRERVNFVGALTACKKMGLINEEIVWLEIGPHPVCQAFIQNNVSATKTFASLRRNEEDFLTIVKTMVGLQCEGFPIIWNEYFAPYEKTYDLLHLDHYSWNLKNYWLPYKGTWTLDKAHEKTFESQNVTHLSKKSSSLPLISSSVHRIVSDNFRDSKRWLVTMTDVMREDLWNAVHSHRIRKVEVASSSIWVDMAYTIAEYLYKDFVPEIEEFSIDLADFNVSHSTLARKDRSKPQLLQIQACLDLKLRSTTIEWYKISVEGVPLSDPYASATVRYENPALWKREWRVIEQFLNLNIENLLRKAQEGTASKFSKEMVYSLFKNIVEYDEFYQCIQCIILDGYEAFSEVTLSSDRHGDWLIPPHFTESLLSLAGFIMNCGDQFNHQENFAISPGWEDLRFIKRLEPGEKLRCYVKMISSKQHRNFYGDVIVIQDNEIIGMCNQMKFRRVPRILMDKFFGPSDSSVKTQPTTTSSNPQYSEAFERPVKPLEDFYPTPSKIEKDLITVSNTVTTTDAISNLIVNEENQLINNVNNLIARETGLNISDLTDESTFVELGVDSLTSLVLAQKLHLEMNIDIQSTIFLDCPTMKEFRKYIASK